MDYPTLLLQLENQLQSLHKKGLNYINIEAMPKVKLKLLLDGLEEMMCTKTEISKKDLKELSKKSDLKGLQHVTKIGRAHV